MKRKVRATEKEYRSVQSKVFKVASRSRELGCENRELGRKIERLEKEIGMLTVKKQELVNRGGKSKGMGSVIGVIGSVGVGDRGNGDLEMKLKSTEQKGKKFGNERCWKLVGIGMCGLCIGLIILKKTSK